METHMSRDDIESLVHRYSDAVVHSNREQWADTWADDATWDLGKGRRVEGRAAILEMWIGAMERFEAVVQTVMNGTAELDEAAGTGTGRWYIHEVVQRSNGDRTLMVGHYDDRYVRTDAGWKFATRELVQHYSGNADLSGTFRAAEAPDA
jgi:ketosteroid isomerase-like protein